MSDLPKHMAAVLTLAKKTARVLDCEPDQLVVVLGRDAYVRLLKEVATEYAVSSDVNGQLYLHGIRVLKDPDVPGETAYAMPLNAYVDRQFVVQRYKEAAVQDVLRYVATARASRG